MKLSNKQTKALAMLDEYIENSPMCRKSYTDDAFYRQFPELKDGERRDISGEEAYFLFTDTGTKTFPTGMERFKQLMVAHRLRTISIAMIKEDIPKGIVFWKDFENMPLFLQSLKRSCDL